jgi:hypothetical protein
MFFLNDPKKQPPTLFIRSNWEPPTAAIPFEFKSRMLEFTWEVENLFKEKRCATNLLPQQHIQLQNLKQNTSLVSFKSDKNLGPCVIDRESYITRAYFEHLHDKKIYKQLQPSEAKQQIKFLKHRINVNFINKFFPTNHPDKTYLQRSLDVLDPFGYFYLLAKVHKNPWVTRPVISTSGCILQGLGKWVDTQLKIICKTLPYVTSSSYELHNELKQFQIPKNCKFITMIAKSMYTNINTKHALKTIKNYIKTTIIVGINPDAVITALEILMKNNYFKFGDSYWQQLSGTAMGTPPAPNYATLYYAIHEMSLIHKFKNIIFYRRYIDEFLLYGNYIHSQHTIKNYYNNFNIQSTTGS